MQIAGRDRLGVYEREYMFPDMLIASRQCMRRSSEYFKVLANHPEYVRSQKLSNSKRCTLVTSTSDELIRSHERRQVL
jgi:hypothetical protein